MITIFKKFKSISNSAGGVVLRKGKICVTFDSEGRGFLPKGRIENGETPLEAARREVFEETGLTNLRLVKKLGIVRRPNCIDPSELKIIHFFLFQTNQQELNPQEGEDEAKWVEVNEAIQRIYTKEERGFLELHKNEIVPDHKRRI